MEPDLRGQPRPARQSRPDPARPGAEDPAAGRLTGARRIPFPITETLHDTQDAQYRDRRRPARYAGAGRLQEGPGRGGDDRSEEHTSELQSLMRISYAVFCLKKKKKTTQTIQQPNQ